MDYVRPLERNGRQMLRILVTVKIYDIFHPPGGALELVHRQTVERFRNKNDHSFVNLRVQIPREYAPHEQSA